MAGYLISNRKNGRSATDPFALARELFAVPGWPRFETVEAASRFAPRFDVKESGDAFVIEADLPGVSREALEITFDDNRLTISGSRAAAEKKEDESYHVYERSYGSFSRTFALPANVDGEHIAAKLDSGVLRVTVPKKAEAKARTIEIHSGE